MDKYPKWSAIVAGNEPREKYYFKHKNLKIHNWLPHKKIMQIYDNSSISVVPSRYWPPLSIKNNFFVSIIFDFFSSGL